MAVNFANVYPWILKNSIALKIILKILAYYVLNYKFYNDMEYIACEWMVKLNTLCKLVYCTLLIEFFTSPKDWKLKVMALTLTKIYIYFSSLISCKSLIKYNITNLFTN